MTDEAETARQVAVMVEATRRMVAECEAQRVPREVLAEHMFDTGRTVLARLGGYEVMADCCRKLAAAYEEAAMKDNAKVRH